jgi:hypothetical protein
LPDYNIILRPDLFSPQPKVGAKLGAKTRGIAKADVIEAAGGDLDPNLLARLNRAVEDRIAQDAS